MFLKNNKIRNDLHNALQRNSIFIQNYLRIQRIGTE